MVAHFGKGWALSPSLITLEAEANLYAPNRGKASDGSVGDMAHANRGSKHNTTPFVRALDLTHSPERGFDAVVVADLIAARCKQGAETRVHGIGSYNWQTGSERWFACRHGVWSWIDQDLHGATHKTHMHLEVVDDARKLSTVPWGLLTPPTPPANTAPKEQELEYWRKKSGGATYLIGAGKPIPMTSDGKADYDAQRAKKGEPALRTYIVEDRMIDAAD